MADKVTLYHAALRTTISVSPRTVSAWEKRGWSTSAPKKKRTTKKEAQ